MVQYKEDDQWPGKDYWKLSSNNDWGKSELRKILIRRGVKPSKKVSEERLRYLVSRVLDRGLLVYENCATEELRAFCRRRRIRIPKHVNRNRHRLIALLESADEEVQLTGFFERIPAELRSRIYMQHFEALYWDMSEAEGDAVGPPPIATASRQLYQETYGLFYAHLYVLVSICFSQPRARIWGSFWIDLPLKVLQMLRKVGFHVCFHRDDSILSGMVVLNDEGWQVDVSEEDGEEGFETAAKRAEKVFHDFFALKSGALLDRGDLDKLVEEMDRVR